MKFTGTVKKGKLALHDKDGFNRFLNEIEGDVWIDLKTAPKTRSPQQNAYYRTIIRQIGIHLGYNEDEMHDVIKAKFKIQSTKDLDVEEFSELLDRIIRFAATLGFIVQDPRRTT
tara:strand:- start:523 stop:867 length:345 start_codon:yes stop_codon:yes gene_type:complete